MILELSVRITCMCVCVCHDLLSTSYPQINSTGPCHRVLESCKSKACVQETCGETQSCTGPRFAAAGGPEGTSSFGDWVSRNSSDGFLVGIAWVFGRRLLTRRF